MTTPRQVICRRLVKTQSERVEARGQTIQVGQVSMARCSPPVIAAAIKTDRCADRFGRNLRIAIASIHGAPLEFDSSLCGKISHVKRSGIVSHATCCYKFA